MNDDVERDDEETRKEDQEAKARPEEGTPTPPRAAKPEGESAPPDHFKDAPDANDDHGSDGDLDEEDDEAEEDDDETEEDEDEEIEPRDTTSSAPPSNKESSTRSSRDSDVFRQQRKRLETTLRDVLRKAVERGVDAGVGAIEQSVDVIERSMEAGRGRVKTANSVLRDVIDEVKIPKDLPKDIAGMIFSQIEEGKNVLVGAVASEVRGFLEETDVAFELQRVLTSLSFEISTEIRFVPNERGMPRPEVRSKARPKVSSRRARRKKRDEEPKED